MKSLGIIGGLGPMATAYLLQLIIEMTDAKTDQEHLDVIVFDRPSVPDRTSYILDPEKPSPLPSHAANCANTGTAGSWLPLCALRHLSLFLPGTCRQRLHPLSQYADGNRTGTESCRTQKGRHSGHYRHSEHRSVPNRLGSLRTGVRRAWFIRPKPCDVSDL